MASQGSKTTTARRAVEANIFKQPGRYDGTEGAFFALPTSIVNEAANPPTFTEASTAGTGYRRFDLSSISTAYDADDTIKTAVTFQMATLTASIGGPLRWGAICTGLTAGVADAKILDVLTDGAMCVGLVNVTAGVGTIHAPGHIMQNDWLIALKEPQGATLPAELTASLTHFYKIANANIGAGTFQLVEEAGTAITFAATGDAGTLLAIHVVEVANGVFVANTAPQVLAGNFTMKDT